MVFQILEKGCEGLSNVELIRAGISDRRVDALTIRIPLLYGMLPEPALATVAGGEGAALEEQIRLQPLDDFVDRLEGLRFIKVDIEGHEPAFFAGAAGVIDRFLPVIQFEENKMNDRLDLYESICRRFRYRLMRVDGAGRLLPFDKSGPASDYNFYLLSEDFQVSKARDGREN
jgi:hypothetical protein